MIVAPASKREAHPSNYKSERDGTANIDDSMHCGTLVLKLNLFRPSNLTY